MVQELQIMGESKSGKRDGGKNHYDVNLALQQPLSYQGGFTGIMIEAMIEVSLE